jgi:glyoxylase-like metal-dependent hydrolase (beta-lactamase superfamily II)
MREIVPDVFTWQWFSQRHGYDFNGYLVRAPGGNLAIDPVEMSDDVLDELAREAVSRIVLTNRNHTRAAGKLRARTGARVAIHPADATFAQERNATHIDEHLVVGEKVGPLVVLDAHGKSPGEVALHWPERRILFIGDACVGKVPGTLALLPETVIDDVAALKRTLRLLADGVEFDTLLLGDGHSVLHDAKRALRALVERF